MNAATTARPASPPLLLSAAALTLALLAALLPPTAAVSLGVLALIIIAMVTVTWMLRGRDLFAPTALFPLAYFAYFALGSFNITSHWASAKVQILAAVALVFYVVGVWLAGLVSGTPSVTWPRAIKPLTLRWHPVAWRMDLVALIGMGVALLATLMIIRSTGGLPLTHLSSRHELSAYLFGFAELGWVTAIWWNFDRWSRHRRVHWMGVAMLAAMAVMMAGLAFRTPLLTMVMISALGYHRLVKPLGAARLAMLMSVLVLFAGIYGWMRLQSNERYGNYSGYLESTGMKWTPFEAISPLVGTVREGTVIMEMLMDNIPERYPHQGGAVTFSTVTTLKPGWQRGPREWVGIYSRGLEHSTTPSILGFFYIDWGIPGVLGGMLLIGFFLGSLHRVMLARPTPLTIWLWAHFTTAFLLAIHTGFADFRHVLLTVYAVGIAWFTHPRPWLWLERPET